MARQNYDVVIIGAGPAGLTAGYLLSKENRSSIVLESSDIVGGISRTPQYKQFYFDIGGHRFFSKSDVIECLWDEMLPNELLHRPRESRIYYRHKFYHYPLKPLNALKQLGVLESIRCVLSYFKAKITPRKPIRHFADWVINEFGERLYLHFFKTYTEKVWGMPCESISADWAAQRIQGMSLGAAIMNALVPNFIKKRKKASVKSLTNTFRYPPRGPGMLWESCAKLYQKNGGNLLLHTSVIRCEYLSHEAIWEITTRDGSGNINKINAKHVVSSAPIKNLVCDYLLPSPDTSCFKAAEKLQYRDFLIVVLIVKDKLQLTDNWIYIHDQSVDVGRIQNFKSWSKDMVPDRALASYGLEYFCNEDDKLWKLSDAALISKATDEIIKIGLAEREDILDGCVVRQPKAYPVYDHDYQNNLSIIEATLKRDCPNLHLVGRNGLHKYNNQDHSMMTAIMTVQNILSDSSVYDVWRVNQDDAYHEESTLSQFDLKSGLRETPLAI